MLAVTFQGNPAYLLDDAPDWSTMEIEAGIPVHTDDRGLTGFETRRPEGNTLRFGLAYSAVLQDAAVPAFRNALQDLNTQPVLCPFWPYQFAAGVVTPTVTASCYVLMGDGAAPEIKQHSDLPFARPAYPLMVGIIEDRPDASLLCGEVEDITIQFRENSPLSLSFPAFVPPNALTDASGATRPLLPWRPNWGRKPMEQIEDDVGREEIGQGRKTADCYYAGKSRRVFKQGFTLSAAETWQLLRLFLDLGALRKNIWVPDGMTEAKLTADIAAIDAVLHVNSPSSRGNNVALLLDDLTNRTAVKVTSTVGNNWNLSGAVGLAYLAANTRIESLVLSRFSTGRIQISWRGNDTTEVSLSFTEVPWEAEATGGETLGTTHGGLPPFSYLYIFSIAYPGATQTWRFTSFEQDLSDGVNTFTATDIEHDLITETATLERHETNLKSRTFIGNPLGLFIPFRLEWPLKLEIWECDVNGGAASNKRCLFVGEVSSVKQRGPYYTAMAKSFSAQHDRKIPRRAIQPTCNWILFEPLDAVTGAGCGLVMDDWKWTGTVVSYDSTTRTLALSGVARVSGPAATLSADYFAAGFMYFGAGSSAQYRMISSSTAAVAGSLSIILATPLGVAPTVGATITFHPGCQGRYKPDCIAKFNNGPRFGGFPFVPVGNPSMLRADKSASYGKK